MMYFLKRWVDFSPVNQSVHLGIYMQRLYTIGYEGAELSEFLTTLHGADVDLVLDVRELPLSRRRGFSKTGLRSALGAASIGYRHERQLGSPRPLRRELHENHDYQAFFAGFSKHLRLQRQLLSTLVEELSGNVALMCYERNHEECHRSLVSKAIAGLVGRQPVHLSV